MRVDAFRPKEDFFKHMDNWIQRFRSAKTIKDEKQVVIPGDPEREQESLRKEQGIPLNKKVVDELISVGEKLGADFPKN